MLFFENHLDLEFIICHLSDDKGSVFINSSEMWECKLNDGTQNKEPWGKIEILWTLSE